MTDAIDELKVRAEILQRRLQAGDPRALARLRKLPAFRRASDGDLAGCGAAMRRQDCLALIAAELGFPNWPQAKDALTGEAVPADFGTLLCPRRCGGHINLWFARYEEASAVREARQGYLLAFRRQFFVVDRYYIEDLCLNPDDPDWEALGFDWARPKSVAARGRLYSKLIAGLPREVV